MPISAVSIIQIDIELYSNRLRGKGSALCDIWTLSESRQEKLFMSLHGDIHMLC